MGEKRAFRFETLSEGRCILDSSKTLGGQGVQRNISRTIRNPLLYPPELQARSRLSLYLPERNVVKARTAKGTTLAAAGVARGPADVRNFPVGGPRRGGRVRRTLSVLAFGALTFLVLPASCLRPRR